MQRKFRQIRWVPLLVTALVFFIIVNAFIGLTATNNIVSNADAGTWEKGISLADKTPSQCEGLGLTDVLVVTSSSVFSPFKGTNANELILGTTGSDNIKGKGGNDCVLGGDGDDGPCFLGFLCSALDGGNGNDVIIGGPGNDKITGGQGDDTIIGGPGDDEITGGQGYDVCLGGDGNDTFEQCENITQ